MSIADGFRTRQALSDLRFLIAAAPVDPRALIASGIPGRRVTEDKVEAGLLALTRGTCADPDARDRLLTALQKAAALPKGDYPLFLSSTMVLLAEALDDRPGLDEVHWHWQAFRDHYRVAAAVQRAAIVQAMRRIGLLRGETTELPVAAPDRATAPTAALRPLLERHRPRGLAPPGLTTTPGVAVLLLDALEDVDAAEEASRLWTDRGPALASSAPHEILAGFRHLYETRDGWSPRSDTAIPLFDPPPGVDWPR